MLLLVVCCRSSLVVGCWLFVGVRWLLLFGIDCVPLCIVACWLLLLFRCSWFVVVRRYCSLLLVVCCVCGCLMFVGSRLLSY